MEYVGDKAASASGQLAAPGSSPGAGPTTDVLSRLRHLVEAATARVRTVEHDNAQLDARIADLSRQNTTLLAERQTLLSRVTSLQEQIGGLEEQRDQLTAQAARLEQQVAALHDEHERLAAQVAGQEEQLHTLQLARGQEQSVLLGLAEDLERLAQTPISTHETARDASAGAGSAVDIVAPDEATAAPAESPASAELAPAASMQTEMPGPQAGQAETTENGVVHVIPPVPAGGTPPATGEIRPATTDETSPSSYTVIAHPFARFSDLGQFQSAVQGLPGVEGVRVRRFAQGILEMRVDYEGQAPLIGLLRDLPIDFEEILQEEPFQLRVRLRS
jgi:phage shock protein A